MKIDTLKLMSGVPIYFEELGFSINQPKLKDIALLGETQFYQSLSYFLVSKERLEIQLEVSDFDLFMYIINQEESIQKSIADIFTLIIDGIESIKFYDSFIIVTALGHECIIDEPKFLIIKESLIQVFCLGGQSASGGLNPVNKRAQEIADKLRKRQEKLSANQNKSDTNIFINLISILTIGSNNLRLEDCLSMTVYQIQNLIKRYNLYEEYNRQIQALLQGAKDIELVEWTKQF
jgi:hypothetical protein